MRRVMVLVLSIGAAIWMHAHADEAKVTRSRWIIILTISDTASGARLDERELDAKLEFDDLEHCKSVVTRVGPLPATDNFRGVLTCRKVERQEVTL